MGFYEIRQQADECLEQLKALINIQPRVDQSKVGELDGKEQYDRFKIWSANIGVFAYGHASLDHRLSDSTETRRLILELLKSLKDYLRRAIDSIQPSNEANSFQSSFGGSDDSLTSEEAQYLQMAGPSVLSATSAISTQTDDSVSMSTDQDGTPFENRLHGVEQTIDRLYRLTAAIRRQSIIAQDIKAAKFILRDEEGNAISEQFTGFVLKVISHQFPAAPLFLRERLAKSNFIRRRRFMYRKEHQEKLSARYDLAPDHNLVSQVSSSILDIEASGETGTIVNSTKFKVSQRPIVPIRLHSQTSATRVIKGIDKNNIMYQRVPSIRTKIATFYTRQEILPIPDAPKLLQGCKEFECPYCFMMLDMKEAGSAVWSRHVLNDLEPYICVFEDCRDADNLFRDRATWLSHLQEVHACEWVCTEPDHNSSILELEKASDRRAGKESQLGGQKEWHQIFTPIFAICPLCKYEPDTPRIDMILSTQSIDTTNALTRSKAISDDIVNHLAIHLQWLSIMSLPWQENVDEEPPSVKALSSESNEGDERTENSSNENIEENRTFSTSYNESTQGDYTDSLTSQDESVQSEWRGTQKGPSTPTTIPEEAVSLHGNDELEWDFLNKPKYYGPHRDPILQKFLRRLYLDDESRPNHLEQLELPIYINPPNPAHKSFFGREYALQVIKDELCTSESQEPVVRNASIWPRAYAICAPGGMGKTQVAAQFSLQHRQDFDAIFWINADNVNELAHGFKDMALRLGLVAEDSIDSNDLRYMRQLVKKWLVEPRARGRLASWLLIFDGVEDPDILNEYWPYDGPGSILITSRNPFSWSRSLSLKPFTPDEAAAFLLKITERQVSDADRETVAAIVQRLGGLPLALMQMASIIVRKRLTFAQFLDSYNERQSQQRLLNLHTEPGFRTVNYEHTVASVWAIDNLRCSRKLLNVLAMIDPDRIPEHLLSSNLQYLNLPGYPTSTEEYRIARTELLSCSLITSATPEVEDKVFIHRLVQDVARAQMEASELRQTLDACIKLITARWPFVEFEWRHGVKRWQSCEELLPHVERLKDLFPLVFPSSYSSEDYHFAKLLIDSGWYLYERGHPLQSSKFINLAQSICDTLRARLGEKCGSLGPVDTVTYAELDYSMAELYYNRGCIASETNKPDQAMSNIQFFHDMMLKELGGKHGGTDLRLAIAWNELGNAYMLQDDWKKGEECFCMAMAAVRQLDDFKPTRLSLPTVNLGYSYWLQGRFEEALKILEKGLQDREEEFGIEDRISFISGRFLHALGNVYASISKADQSFVYHHRALLHYKATLGTNHHRTADVFVKVADHDLRTRQYSIAIPLLRHALKAYSTSNNYIPEKARASFKLSQALKGISKSKDGEKEGKVAWQWYNEARKSSNKTKNWKTKIEDLVDEDFDDLIAFWSK